MIKDYILRLKENIKRLNFPKYAFAIKKADFNFVNFQKLVTNKKFLVVFLMSFYTILWLIGFVFIDKKTQKYQLTTLPYQEKVADGVYKLMNQDPIRQVLAEGKKADLNLKEVKIQNSKGKSTSDNSKVEQYKWEVTNANGTKFEFGLVDSKTPQGKVAPVVRVVNKEGWFVQYQPQIKDQKSNLKNKDGDPEIINHQSSIINQFVTPKVNKNVISWEISKGVVARYTMMQDRVKADYIVDSKETLCYSSTKSEGRVEKFSTCSNNKLEFDVISGQIDLKSSIINPKSSLKGELMPGGDIDWFVDSVDSLGPTQTQFTFPAPVVTDSQIRDKKSAISNPPASQAKALRAGQPSAISSKYKFSKTNNESYSLAIVLDPDQLEKATFPIIIDPVVIAVANFEGTQFTNGRKIIRDQWGNLIVHFRNDVDTSANIYYKNYNSSSWVDDTNTIAEIQADPAIDIDSSGNVHVAFRNNGQIFYNKINITRSGNNTISSIAWEAPTVSFTIDSGFREARPSLIIANKGGGAGVEKIAIAYAMNATTGTIRNEIRFMQCDVADACATTAASWKNASEEINGSGTCSEGTSGGVGLPNATTCKGTADKILATTAAFTKHNAVLTQIPGKPKRSPASVKKDINGTFSDLNNTIDNNTGTTDDVNSLTTTDYIYVGDDKPFSKATFDLTNLNSGSGNATFGTFQYWDGATWTSLSNFVDNTYNKLSGSGCSTLPCGTFWEDGSVFFDEPSNWTTTTVNGVSGKYWIRIRPTVSLDSTVSIAEVYVNDRNSKALLIVGGVDSTDDLGAAYVVWDEISNDRWENVLNETSPYGIGAPWRGGITALDTLGANYTTFTRNPLTAAVDYKNNGVYVSYVEDLATDVLHVKKIANNLDPTVAANWTDTGFPAVTMAADVAFSLTADGADIYLFYVLDSDASDVAFRKCIPSGGGDMNICDNASDWGSQKVLSRYTLGTTQPTDPQAVVSKVTGDTVAIDVIYTNTLATVNVSYERHYVDLADKTVTVAVSGDDAFQRDCVSGTDDQDITATTVKLGRETADASCVSTVDSENHIGLRFPAITVVQGAVISSAYVDLRVTTRTGSTPIDFTIYGEDADNSAAFTAFTDCADPCSNGVNTRTKTTSSTVQSVDFSTNTYRIDVTDLVQEIVCRGAANSQPCVGNFNGSGTWASGNALTLLLISAEGGASDNNILAVSQDDTSTVAIDPTIQINCVGSCTTANPPNTTWCSIGGGANAAGDCNANWGSRKKLTFDNRASTENLANFPVLVRLNSGTIDYTKTQGSGQDLRFVDADGSTLLKYEIEKWDEAGESLVWVNVPQIDLGVASDYIYMYYNNSSGAAGQDAVNTWNSNYNGVWHLGEGDSTASNFYQDSTTNNNDGTLVDTNADSTQDTSGAVGNAMSLTGNADYDYINIVNSNSLNNTGTGWGNGGNPVTISAWIKPGNITQINRYVIAKDAAGSNVGDVSLIFNPDTSCGYTVPDRFSLYQQYTNNCAVANVISGNTNSIIAANTWYHEEVTVSGTTALFYEDGKLASTSANFSRTWNNNTDVQLGAAGSAPFAFTGSIDEVRISGNVARSASWIEADYLSTKPNSNFVSIAAEQTVAGPSIRKYSLGSAVQLATGSASFADLDHPFSASEYVALEGDDLSYALAPFTTNYASQSAAPVFMFKVNNPNNSNSYKIETTAVVRSTATTSAKPIYLQIYRGGSTNDWVTVATDNSSAADTDITLTSQAISANTSEYYFNETPGIGTQYAACTNGTANCWNYFRVYQDPPGTGQNEILAADYFNTTYTVLAPDKVGFSNATRTLTAAACNGAANVFTMELQNGTTPTNPQASTVVRVTSNSSSYTIYSDDTCSTSVTNGDFTYTTSQNTKSVYIIDNKKSLTTRTLTGTRQSGDTLTTGTQNYTVNAGAVSKLVITLPGQTFTDGTGNSGTVTNQLSGMRFLIQINATDANFNVNTSYTGDKVLVFSGPGVGSATPTVLDKNNAAVNYGSNTTITFSSGAASNVFTTLYKGESVTITAADGGSYGNASATLTIDVPNTKIRGGSTIRGGSKIQ